MVGARLRLAPANADETLAGGSMSACLGVPEGDVRPQPDSVSACARRSWRTLADDDAVWVGRGIVRR